MKKVERTINKLKQFKVLFSLGISGELKTKREWYLLLFWSYNSKLCFHLRLVIEKSMKVSFF